MKLILSLFFVLFISAPLISGLGIIPGKTSLEFEPGAVKKISFSLINSEHKEIAVLFLLRGELNDSITLEKAYTEFNARDEAKSFSFELHMPQKFAEPGNHRGEILALELPKDFQSRGTVVGSTLAVISEVEIHVPYPGKYLDAEVHIVPGKETLFLIPVLSRGKLDIGSLKGIVDVYAGEKKITTLETEEDSLKSLQRKELVTRWKDSPPGTYTARTSVVYDEQITTVEKDFVLGEGFLEFVSLSVKDFQLGGIAKFTALIENKQAREIPEANLEIKIYNGQREVMADVKSPSSILTALSKSTLIAYWDTVGVKEGSYDGQVILHAGGVTVEKSVQLKVKEDGIDILGITGNVISGGKGGFNFSAFLVLAVVVLILVNVGWFIVLKKYLRKKEAVQKEKGVLRIRK